MVNNLQNCVNVFCERPRTSRLTATKVCPVAEKERLGGSSSKLSHFSRAPATSAQQHTEQLVPVKEDSDIAVTWQTIKVEKV